MSREIQNYNNDRDSFTQLSPYPVNNGNGSASQGLDPRTIVLKILKYKWLILLFLIAGGTGGWFYAESITPIYESKGTLLISSGKAGETDLSRIVSQTTGVGANATLANELEVLKSLSFASNVAERMMDKETDDVNEFPVLWSQVGEGEFVRSDLRTVANRIRNNIKFQLVNRESEVVQATFESSSPLEAAEVVNVVMDLYVETSTKQNRQAAEATTEFLETERVKLQRELEQAERQLQSFMDRTGLVRLDNQAAGIVNRIEQIDVQIEEIELNLEAVNLAIQNNERELERLKPGVADDFAAAVAPRIRAFQDEMGQYERERFLILQRNPGVRDREVTPPRLKFLDEQIETLKEEITSLSQSIFSEDDEYMGMETAERTQMMTQIQGRLIELRIEKTQLESRMEALKQRLRQTERELDGLPNEMTNLARLQRDVQMKEKLFINISEQYADVSTWKETQYGYGRIIDYANAPRVPVSPRKTILLIMGLMLSGIAAASVIIMKEFFDNTMNSIDEVKSSNLPMLAAVPQLEKRIAKKNQKSFAKGNGNIPRELVSLRDRTSLVSESIRRLKNNIVYQNANDVPKTIAITSPEKGDGKSTIVSNLAITFADEGYKTLLIDCDFRRPKVHTYFGLSNKIGLSNYLQEAIPLTELIRHTDLGNLKVITAGSNIQKPETLANSKEFMEFVTKMEDIFDVVIFDTPPFGIISDATALLKRVDATVVVAKYRKTNKGIFVHTLEELQRINANVSGFVLNDFDPRKDTSGYYGSGYYQSLKKGYESYA
jgi:capsular exopolysaccharide synthesis family protein